MTMLMVMITLTACEEKGVSDHSRHRRHRHEPATLNPVTESLVYNWEQLLASGELLKQTTPAHFNEFHQAILGGVFDPNTILSSAEIKKIGPSNCTSSPNDLTIGVRRFERTLTMAPDFQTMTDAQGHTLRDWLLQLKRKDLLQALEALTPPPAPPKSAPPFWRYWWPWP
jgi:hypothetical protein